MSQVWESSGQEGGVLWSRSTSFPRWQDLIWRVQWRETWILKVSAEYEMAECWLPGLGGKKIWSLLSEFWGQLTAGSQWPGLTEYTWLSLRGWISRWELCLNIGKIKQQHIYSTPSSHTTKQNNGWDKGKSWWLLPTPSHKRSRQVVCQPSSFFPSISAVPAGWWGMSPSLGRG